MRRKFTAAIAVVALIESVVAAATPADARWRHRHHHGGWGGGAALGGFAAGAILGGALAAQRPYYGYGPGPVYYDAGPGYYGGDAVGYCMRRVKSYDPASGTYLGYDGYRHPCP